jgi:hypothetical protein
MKIDRTLFLFLTGSIAAVACSANAPPQPAVGASSASASATSTSTATPTASSGTLTSSPPPTPTDSATAPPPTASASVPDAGAPVASSAPTASLPPVDPSTLKPVGPDTGCGKGKRTYDDTRTNCDDTAGAMPDCGTIQMGYASSEVCPGPVAARRRCFVATTNFKPAVAQAVHACLGKTTGKYCNSCNFYQCNYNALMGACPDPTADAACDKIARSCNGFDKLRCRSYLSGMSAKGRENMVSCLTSSCSKGFLMCLQGLPEHT